MPRRESRLALTSGFSSLASRLTRVGATTLVLYVYGGLQANPSRRSGAPSGRCYAIGGGTLMRFSNRCAVQCFDDVARCARYVRQRSLGRPTRRIALPDMQLWIGPYRGLGSGRKAHPFGASATERGIADRWLTDEGLGVAQRELSRLARKVAVALLGDVAVL